MEGTLSIGPSEFKKVYILLKICYKSKTKIIINNSTIVKKIIILEMIN